jgi:hypothetical protein
MASDGVPHCVRNSTETIQGDWLYAVARILRFMGSFRYWHRTNSVECTTGRGPCVDILLDIHPGRNLAHRSRKTGRSWSRSSGTGAMKKASTSTIYSVAVFNETRQPDNVLSRARIHCLLQYLFAKDQRQVTVPRNWRSLSA